MFCNPDKRGVELVEHPLSFAYVFQTLVGVKHVFRPNLAFGTHMWRYDLKGLLKCLKCAAPGLLQLERLNVVLLQTGATGNF